MKHVTALNSCGAAHTPCLSTCRALYHYQYSNISLFVLFLHCTAKQHAGVSSGGSSSGWSSDSRQLAVVAPSSDAGVSRDKPQWEEGVYHGGVITDETERLAAIATCHSVAINYILVSSNCFLRCCLHSHCCYKHALWSCMMCSDRSCDTGSMRLDTVAVLTAAVAVASAVRSLALASPAAVYRVSANSSTIACSHTLCAHVRTLWQQAAAESSGSTAQVTRRSAKAQFRAALSMAVGSKNRGFHYELYSQFQDKDNSVLRDIRSEFIEEWLREHDADLLHRLSWFYGLPAQPLHNRYSADSVTVELLAVACRWRTAHMMRTAHCIAYRSSCSCCWRYSQSVLCSY
eukprot:10867-Heterococcus_DN1.PRE.6